MTDYGLCQVPMRAPDYEKDPDDTIDYTLSWHQLGSDTIISSSWASDGLTIVSDSVDGLAATVFVSGGSEGAIYYLTNSIVSGMGRSLDRTIYVGVRSL